MMEPEVSLDAEGVPPRPEQPYGPKIEFAREPPRDWRLNVLLEEIASSLDHRELERIKLLFRGSDGLGKKTLENCVTFIQLFVVLREQFFISRGNLVYLNKILYTLGRKDLIEKCVRYCRDEGNSVICYKEEIKDDGYTPVIIHIATEINSIDMETIDRLKNNVAKIVCVPVEYIRVAAISSESSVLVTLLIPDVYVAILQTLLQGKYNLWELVALRAKIVKIGGKDVPPGKHGVEIEETDQQKYLMNIYEQSEKAKQLQRKLELQAIERSNEIQKLREETERREKKLQKEIEDLYRERTEHLAALSLLQRMRLAAPDGAKAMSDFQKAIAEANYKHQDMTIVKRLVDSSTLVVSAYIRNSIKAERKLNKAILEERKAKECELLHQLLTGALTAEKVLYTKYSCYTLGGSVALNPEPVKVLGELSKCLTDKERYHLMALYSWEENDLVKQCIERDRSLLLLGLECKETENTQQPVQTESFLKRILGAVQRFDLENRYTELLSSQRNERLATGTYFHVQSRIQVHSPGQTAVNELHNVYETTTNLLELVKEVHNYLLHPAPIRVSDRCDSQLLWRPYQYHPKPHPVTFTSFHTYALKFGNILKNIFPLHYFG